MINTPRVGFAIDLGIMAQTMLLVQWKRAWAAQIGALDQEKLRAHFPCTGNGVQPVLY
jgi:hypothetical protein